MATYTVSGSTLVCTGTNITSADILSALNSNGLGSGHFGQTTGNKDTYFFNAQIQIGSSSSSGASSVWNCSDQIIKINASSFEIYGTVQMGSYPSNISTGGGSFVVTSTSNDTFRLFDNGIFRAYGSFVYAQNRIRMDNDTEFTIIDCDAELEDGVSAGEIPLAYGARQQITYDRSRIHHTGAVGIKLYSFNSGANAASYSLNKTRVEKCTYGFQLGNGNNLSPILKDVQIDTCTYHIVPNLGDANITFVNPDFTVLRGALINGNDITTIAFRYNFKVQDASSVAIQNAKVFIVDQNNDIVVNAESTDANGLINSHLYNYDGDVCLRNSTFAGNTKTNRENHTRLAYKYGFLLKSDTVAINQDTKDFLSLLQDLDITESNKSTVDAYTEIDTSAKFYDRAASHLEDNLGTYTNFLVTKTGDEIDAGSYNVTIDATASSVFTVSGNTITIKASTYTGDMVTTGVITLVNGSNFDGTRTDANGTILPPQPVSITNIVAGSRLQIYNVTTGTEIVNQIVSGTSYSTTYVEGTDYTDGDTVRVRLTYVSGTTAKAEYTTNVIDTSNGWSVLAEQQDNDIYNALAIDGSSVTNFVADYTNDEVDVSIATNFNLSDFYAWWVYNMTTAQGIREFFGGITALDEANFRINTGTLSLYFDNITSTNLVQLDNRRIFRADGVYPVVASTTGGSGIDVVWRNTILIAETDTTGLTPEESAKLTSIASDSSLIPGIASKTSLILVK